MHYLTDNAALTKVSIEKLTSKTYEVKQVISRLIISSHKNATTSGSTGVVVTHDKQKVGANQRTLQFLLAIVLCYKLYIVYSCLDVQVVGIPLVIVKMTITCVKAIVCVSPLRVYPRQQHKRSVTILRHKRQNIVMTVSQHLGHVNSNPLFIYTQFST